MGLFDRLKQGLSKTKANISDNMDIIFNTYGYEKVSEEFLEELEETMIMGDIGVQTTEELLDDLRQKVKDERIRYCPDCRQELILGIRNKMKQSKDAYAFEEGPAVILVIGVNGVGKTTSVGKLAANYRKQGKKVLIASADTFRAAANEQLTEWAKRAGVDIIGAAEGSDPAAVVYDAVQAAKARKTDILLVDTAGRLHNKKNLMAELSKIDRIITREYPGLPGKRVCQCHESDRYSPHQDGRNRQGRHRHCRTGGTGDPGEVHRRRRSDRGPAEVQPRPVRGCDFLLINKGSCTQHCL